jgi:hypothetical protein
MAVADTRRAPGTRDRNVEVATPCSDDETDGNLTHGLHESSPRGLRNRFSDHWRQWRGVRNATGCWWPSCYIIVVAMVILQFRELRLLNPGGQAIEVRRDSNFVKVVEAGILVTARILYVWTRQAGRQREHRSQG